MLNNNNNNNNNPDVNHMHYNYSGHEVINLDRNVDMNLDNYHFEYRAKTDFANLGRVHKLIRNDNRHARNRFYGAWASMLAENERVVPVVCYHGTSVNNIPHILKDGLKVPGVGNTLSVVNGSAYGKGIYLALRPETSHPYVRNGSEMLMCVALVGNRFITRNDGNILVVTNPTQVLVVGTIHYESRVKVEKVVKKPAVPLPTLPVHTVAKPDSEKSKRKAKKRLAKQKRLQKSWLI